MKGGWQTPGSGVTHVRSLARRVAYKLFWRQNPQKILLTIFNFDLNVNKCPILPLFTVHFVTSVRLFFSLSLTLTLENNLTKREKKVEKWFARRATVREVGCEMGRI